MNDSTQYNRYLDLPSLTVGKFNNHRQSTGPKHNRPACRYILVEQPYQLSHG